MAVPDEKQKLQTLWDERAITHSMLKFARSRDTQDWIAHSDCFTDPVNIDFKKFTGLNEVRVSPRLWESFAELILAGATRHHLLGTFRIDVQGGRPTPVLT
jgi:SnoaL-like domain